MLKILGIAGSLRRDSWNRRLLVAAADLTPDRVELELYPTLGDLPLFNEDEEQVETGGPPAVADLRSAVRKADGLLISTPEYNQSMPGVLKNAIDWLSRPGPDQVFAGKPVALTGATTGAWGTRLAQHAVRQTLAAAGAVVPPGPMLFVADAPSLFDDRGCLTDGRTSRSLRKLLAAFATWIEQASPGTR